MAAKSIPLMRMASPDGRIGHAEIRLGDSVIMLADEHPEMGHRGPQSLGGVAVSRGRFKTPSDTNGLLRRTLRMSHPRNCGAGLKNPCRMRPYS
jgi:hypothetical protein